jgi:hypothetical protein
LIFWESGDVPDRWRHFQAGACHAAHFQNTLKLACSRATRGGRCPTTGRGSKRTTSLPTSAISACRGTFRLRSQGGGSQRYHPSARMATPCGARCAFRFVLRVSLTKEDTSELLGHQRHPMHRLCSLLLALDPHMIFVVAGLANCVNLTSTIAIHKHYCYPQFMSLFALEGP